MTSQRRHIRLPGRLWLLLAFGLVFGWLAVSLSAWADECYYCVCDCECAIIGATTVQAYFEDNEISVQEYFDNAMQNYEKWLDDTLYGQDLEPTMQAMASQLSSIMMLETFAIGSYIDAKQQMETQTLFQELTARAHKDYQPSYGMCVFGTNIRSLAAADDNAALTEKVLSQQSQQRQLQASDAAATNGPRSDSDSRLQAFANRYCDRYDNDPTVSAATGAINPNTGLGKICTTSPTADSLNKDIDYLRTLLLPRTLNMDFSDNVVTTDEQDVIAMSRNLYANQLFTNIAAPIWAVRNNQATYLDMRSVIAKRSVAQASFDAIAALKSSGSVASAGTATTPGAAQYMTSLLNELGMPAVEITAFLGTQPSYLAQMEVLAKKIYQRPEFYTELYKSPANVERRSVAMQAIGTMLDRDIFKSYLRSEALMSVLLEARLKPLQDQVASEGSKLPTEAP